MSRELHMPSLGADMEAGTLVEWRVQPGGQIHRGDVVALVETEKGIIDVESFEEGVVEKITVQPGTRVPVGTVLALLAGEAPGLSAADGRAPVATTGGAPAVIAGGTSAAPPAKAPEAAPAGPPQETPQREPSAGAATPAIRHVSPAARVRAKALGVDLATVHGTGPGGVITLQDVERAAAAAAGPPAPGTAQPVIVGKTGADVRAGIRNAIAASMSRAKREIPHYYLQLNMDFSVAAHWLAAYNEARPPPERLLPSVLMLKAVACSAAEKSGFNGYYGAHGYEASRAVHLGVAIALRGGGLVAPALFDASQKTLPTLMRELQDLVGRVRSGHMRSSEISSATLTVTSLGDEGVDAVLPIIYPPQVAIIGFGSVVERPWVVDGRVEARPVLNLSLAADHRVSDGRQGAQFLARVRDRLMRPAEL